MKNMKLAVKLSLGFGILLALALLLGGMSVWQMWQVESNADLLLLENMPMSKASGSAQDDMELARYEIRAFGLTGEDSYHLRGLKNIEGVQAHLKQALALIDKYPELSDMKENIRKAVDKTAEYATMVEETANLKKAIHAIYARQDESSSQFMSNSYKYLDNHNKKLEALSLEAVTSENLARQGDDLKMRLFKITVINDIIDAGNRLQVVNWKSQALRDPALGKAAIKDFEMIRRKIAELEPITTQQDNKEQLAALKSAAEQYHSAMSEFTSKATELAALEIKRTSTSDAAIEAVSGNAAECMKHIDATMTKSSEVLDHASRIMIVGFLVVALMGIGIAVYLTRAITRPILKGVAFANELAKGDFSQRLDIDQHDEIGILARALNTVVDNLQSQVKEIREAANALAASAGEISASVTQVTSGAQETAAAVTQTTATVEEVKQGAHLTSQKTKVVAETSHKGLQLAHTGRKATETLAEGMTRINEQMASIADTIMKLGEQSQAIGEITSTVDDIAGQSNLLAVNAAVEAAKAGEYGKGFSVVAQEIKSLSEQSKQATKQVRGILNDIQKATGAAVMATEQGSKAVDQGMKESMNANESIQALSNSFTEAVQSAGQIAASTQEQLTGMDQVAMAMESIKEASQQNVASMQQLEIAAQSLKDIGHKFTELIGRYKV
jgi:methyl-accepting chemotaxis protein